MSNPTSGSVTINNLTPDLLRTLTVSNDLTDLDGALTLVGYQWQQSLDGTVWSNITGATSSSFTTATSGVQLRVEASYTVGGGAVETMYSAETAPVLSYHIVTGTNAAGESLAGTVVADRITGLGGPDALIGLEGNDTLIGGAGNDYLNGGLGADSMTGGQDNDTYSVDDADDVVVEAAGEGLDRVISSFSYTLGDNVENLSLTGSTAINGTGNALNNSIIGNSAANALSGGGGNDTLNGGLGADTMSGGQGNDTYTLDSISDVVIEASGEGTDAVSIGFTYTLGANIETLVLSGTAAINGTGNELDNALIGNSAGNTLRGGAGNDTLDGRAGADSMFGGLGDDIFRIDNVGDVVNEIANEGNDTVFSTVTYTLSHSLENLKLLGTATINGTGNAHNNVMTGNSADNVLSGGSGDDTFSGGAGNDTLVGELGDDLYKVYDNSDTITEAIGQGTDKVISSISYTLGANLENLTLTDAALNGTGNALNNIIIGTIAANVLTGDDGNDELNGDAGDDTLIGGLGDDLYHVDSLGDVVTENAGEGTDGINSAITYTLAADFENLTLTGTDAIDGTGNALNNVITGNSATNNFIGGGGNDTFVGGAGDDFYTVTNTGIVITEAVGEGIDSVTSSVTHTMASNVENLTLTGVAVIDGNGSGEANTIIGNDANNILNGNGGNDTLVGGAGDDRLSGGSGIDSMTGGLGDETYYVDDAADVIIEAAGEGYDRVITSVSYTLSANIERISTQGTAAINLTGNADGNVMIGNVAANTLSGGDGNDTINGGDGADILNGGNGADLLLGGAGNDSFTGAAGIDSMTGGLGDDTYFVGDTGDVINEAVGEGSDKVITSVSYTLSANIERISIQGTAAINLTGNADGNVIIGNAAANTLSGGDGNDTISGSGGTDILIGGNGLEQFIFAALTDSQVGAGVRDIITDFVSGTDRISLSSIDANTVTGGDQAFTLINTAAFSSVAGQLRYEVTGGNTILEGDVGGDGVADFQIELTGVHSFVAADLIL